MLPLLTSAAMQAADQQTIQSFGMPAFTLMESAGRAAAAALMTDFNPRFVNILCGKGNNGGDGLVVARYLQARGVSVRVVFVGDRNTATEETKLNLSLLAQLAEKDTAALLRIWYYQEVHELAYLAKPDVWVDALLGTGLQAVVRSPYAAVIQWLNAQQQPIVALDIASGLDATTGHVLGAAVLATKTYTMGAYKVGHWLNAGRTHSGEVQVLEMGIPAFCIAEKATQAGCAWLPTVKEAAAALPKRGWDAHKYKVGYLTILAGSQGFTGAAVLCTQAAERIGAGGVVAASTVSAQAVLAQKLTTAMTLGLPESKDGGLEISGLDRLAELMQKSKAMLIGSGLGRVESTQTMVKYWLSKVEVPLVLDADGLNALVGNTGLLKQAQGRWVLTPHWGEFKRLVGREDLDEANRLDLVQQYAQTWGCVVVLKGFPGLIASPEGKVVVNPTGNPAAATAGSGDVLAGCIAGFLAQGLPAFEAAWLGYYVAGLAAERYTQTRAAAGMIASDLIEELPYTLKALELV